MEVLNRILEWIEKHLPGILLAFGLGYRQGREESEELKKKLLAEETKRKLLENEVSIEKAHSGKSSRDVVDELVGRHTTPESSKPKS